MIFTCIIVDDEPHAVQQLTECINDTPILELIKSYSNPSIALHEITQMQKPVDILFADVEMPSLSGLQLAEKLGDKVKFLILVSGHLKYSLEGYTVQATNFLLKPFTFNRFKKIVSSIIEKERPFVFLKTKGDKEVIKIYVDEIFYLKAARNYTQIGMDKKDLIVISSLSDIEEKLKDYLYFIRIHKSIIVSAKHIEKLKNNYIYLSNGILLSASQSYKPEFDN